MALKCIGISGQNMRYDLIYGTFSNKLFKRKFMVFECTENKVRYSE